MLPVFSHDHQNPKIKPRYLRGNQLPMTAIYDGQPIDCHRPDIAKNSTNSISIELLKLLITIIANHTPRNPIGSIILMGKWSLSCPLMNKPIEYQIKNEKSIIPKLLVPSHPSPGGSLLSTEGFSIDQL